MCLTGRNSTLNLLRISSSFLLHEFSSNTVNAINAKILIIIFILLIFKCLMLNYQLV
ncbi:hypothetical protein IX324_002236 [Bacteroides pyogenes]|nr:hypothetical protein [Bacteroides pyogenes]